jgi:hypothetical protein
MPDVDIDFLDREQALGLFKHIPASRIDHDKLVKHNTGVYLHPVPVNAVSGLCAVPYDQADSRGYFKVDFLNVGIYKGVRDEAHLIALMNQTPIWALLEQDEFTDMIFHVNGHGSILREMKPKCLEELAAVLAMIRPAKRYLIGKDWLTVMSEVWTKPRMRVLLEEKSCFCIRTWQWLYR